MRPRVLRRCAGAMLLVVLPFQGAGCAVGAYSYEPHPLPGAPFDTLAIRQLMGESVRLTLRSGTSFRVTDATLQGDTIWGAGTMVPLDSVARVDIIRSDPGKAVVTSGTAAAASATVAGVALGAVVTVGTILLIKALFRGIVGVFDDWGRSSPLDIRQ